MGVLRQFQARRTLAALAANFGTVHHGTRRENDIFGECKVHVGAFCNLQVR